MLHMLKERWLAGFEPTLSDYYSDALTIIAHLTYNIWVELPRFIERSNSLNYHDPRSRLLTLRL